MQKSAKAQIKKQFTHKFLFICLSVAVVIFIVFMVRNAWLEVNLQQMQTKQQVASLQNKFDMLHQDIRVAGINHPVNVDAYTTSQIKDAFLLVRTAAVSLERDHDITVAKQLLQLASEHLANLQGAKVDKAKAILAQDQAKLNAVTFSDVGMVQEKLDTLDKLINIMPAYKNHQEPVTTHEQPKTQTKNKKTEPAWYQAILDNLLDVKTVVKVRKKAEREVNVAEVDIARAQFKLTLEQLRWAAFYNNNEVYQRSIRNAQKLLPQMFDMQSESVQKFAATLDELQQVKLRPEVPDLQNSVNALQALLVG